MFIDFELSPIRRLDYTDRLPYIIRFYFFDAQNEDEIKCNFALTWKTFYASDNLKKHLLRNFKNLIFYNLGYSAKQNWSFYYLCLFSWCTAFSYLHHKKNRIKNNQGHDEVLERCRLNNPPKPIFETNSFFWHVTFQRCSMDGKIHARFL